MNKRQRKKMTKKFLAWADDLFERLDHLKEIYANDGKKIHLVKRNFKKYSKDLR